MEKEHLNFRFLFITIIIAVLCAFIIRIFLFEPTLVRGNSMEPTLKDRDRLLISKLAEPERFDIIVFHASEEYNYVKRVIGLPGDHIEYKKDTLYVNGQAYDEPYLDDYKESLTDSGPLTNTFTLEETAVNADVVPEGHLFVMGDNRRDSRDSRHIGAVPLEEVIGTSTLIYYPIRDMKILGK